MTTKNTGNSLVRFVCAIKAAFKTWYKILSSIAPRCLVVFSLPASAFLMWSIVRLIYFPEPAFFPFILIPPSAMVLIGLFMDTFSTPSAGVVKTGSMPETSLILIGYHILSCVSFFFVMIFWLALMLQQRPS